jgi:hypothetical protein
VLLLRLLRAGETLVIIFDVFAPRRRHFIFLRRADVVLAYHDLELTAQLKLEVLHRLKHLIGQPLYFRRIAGIVAAAEISQRVHHLIDLPCVGIVGTEQVADLLQVAQPLIVLALDLANVPGIRTGAGFAAGPLGAVRSAAPIAERTALTAATLRVLSLLTGLTLLSALALLALLPLLPLLPLLTGLLSLLTLLTGLLTRLLPLLSLLTRLLTRLLTGLLSRLALLTRLLPLLAALRILEPALHGFQRAGRFAGFVQRVLHLLLIVVAPRPSLPVPAVSRDR